LRRYPPQIAQNAGIAAGCANIVRVRIALAGVVFALLAAGCGGTDNMSSSQGPATTATTTVTRTVRVPEAKASANTQPLTLHLYYLAPDGKLAATTRSVDPTETPGAATLSALTEAPDGMTTEVPDGLKLAIDNGRATVTGAELNPPALAQVVYALTTFQTVDSVNGKTRADVEAFVPPILVEQPAPDDTVTSPLHVTGNANTYEATFNYQLEDAAGKSLAKDFVTATSGSGTRGTFDVSIPFTIDSAQDGSLRVFELSAEDGTVVHERVIPLRLAP
jgi:germination protein M